MDLMEVSPDDPAALAAYVDISNAASARDAPWQYPLTPYRLEMYARHGWDGEPGRYFIARDGGRDVGVAAVFTSDYDNLDLAWTLLDIHPAERRLGYGGRLRSALDELCSGLGRPLVGAAGWDHPSTIGFAQAMGWPLKSVTVARRQEPPDLPPDLVDHVHAQAAAQAHDYELSRVEGRTPEERLAELAAVGAAINDSPLDDLEFEDEVYSADRMRAYETAQLDSGMRLYRVLARHRGSGELAGHTVVAVDGERPELAHQHDTAVAAPHRGHRLGLLLKAEMVRWLGDREPQIQAIDTFNAESNGPMVRVNELLGYRVMARELLFQRRLAGSARRAVGSS